MLVSAPSDPDIVRIEAKLAEYVRTFIDASRSGDSNLDQDALRWVCSALEFLLNGLLRPYDGWHGWIDGISPATDILGDAIEVASPSELRIRGKALWGQGAGKGPFWIEPFFAVLRIHGKPEELIHYEISFGDAGRGLGKTAYDKHIRREDWFRPVDWLFQFQR
ncbi:MAG: hypothetical protein ACLP59_30795 [Bryobacteraceae bacterium]